MDCLFKAVYRIKKLIGLFVSANKIKPFYLKENMLYNCKSRKNLDIWRESLMFHNIIF